MGRELHGTVLRATAGFFEVDTDEGVLTCKLRGRLKKVKKKTDLCVIGDKGVGKSAIARLFAHRLGYPTETFFMFKDMTSRDLLQRRSTHADGSKQFVLHQQDYAEFIMQDYERRRWQYRRR